MASTSQASATSGTHASSSFEDMAGASPSSVSFEAIVPPVAIISIFFFMQDLCPVCFARYMRSGYSIIHRRPPPVNLMRSGRKIYTEVIANL